MNWDLLVGMVLGAACFALGCWISIMRWERKNW